MFNQGPQKCPGKELAISLLSSACQAYLENNYRQLSRIDPKLNQEEIKQMINPYSIKFTY